MPVTQGWLGKSGLGGESWLFFKLIYFNWRLITLQYSRSGLEPKYRLERCQEVKGICKPFCDDIEYDYGYCIKWRNQCCI
ncbi:beta-defensin 110-like [Capricornis sumatraensis]|uniref:beta-defensin 110-like n=1 Tax=Capricornis sumatraensis TaxID=34865 RepID=UPI0036043711